MRPRSRKEERPNETERKQKQRKEKRNSANEPCNHLGHVGRILELGVIDTDHGDNPGNFLDKVLIRLVQALEWSVVKEWKMR